MAVLAIDINDAGLVVANDSAVLAVEPGFARIERGKIVTGEAAKAGARLSPRQTSNRFWSGLSLEPGSAGSDLAKSAAELAYAQLESLWSKFRDGATDVVLVVPGSYRTDQLGVLLGLAQECGMPVRALVDTAVAASVRPYPKRQLMYVDAGLHQGVRYADRPGRRSASARRARAEPGPRGARRCVRPPDRGSVRACDALRSAYPRRNRATALRSLAAMARSAAARRTCRSSL